MVEYSMPGRGVSYTTWVFNYIRYCMPIHSFASLWKFVSMKLEPILHMKASDKIIIVYSILALVVIVPEMHFISLSVK